MRTRDAILEEMNPNEAYTAGELARKLDRSRTTVDDLLRDLEEKGKVESKKHSARHRTWMLAEDTESSGPSEKDAVAASSD